MNFCLGVVYVYNMRIFQLQVLCSLLSRTCNDIPQETNQKVELGKTHERGSSSHKMLQSKETKSGKLIPIR